MLFSLLSLPTTTLATFATEHSTYYPHSMDHLPYPANPAHDPLRVPLLLKAHTVVDCRASSPVGRLRASRRSHHLPELTRQLQKWLYFGLISRCIGINVAVQDFHSDQRLHSRHLPGLLRHNPIVNALETDLKDVELALRQFSIDHLEPYSSFNQNVDNYNAQLVVLSIRILTDSLWRADRNYGEFADDTFMRHNERYDNPFAPAELHGAILRNRMSWQEGWCKSMVSRLLKTFTASSAYYISAFRHTRAANHGINHEHCTDDRCKLNYDPKNYQYAHTSQCQEDRNEYCRMVEAPRSDVMNILQDGGIPLIKIESNNLVARRAKYGVPYVVATHVWAGGLGNPKGNSMPLCQVQEMSRLTVSSQEALLRFKPSPTPEDVFPTIWETIVNPFRLLPKSPPAWFWIDTLNIPNVDNSSVAKELADDVWAKRTMAIDRMTQTYAAADSAIVLDPEVRQVDLQWHQSASDPDDDGADAVLLQIFASILISSWTTRCWTFQEGAMAKELLVKLKGDIFPMQFARRDVLARNRRRLRDRQYSDIHDMLDEMSAWFSRLPATQENDESVGRKEISQGDDGTPEVFTRIWNDLAARSTSRTVDRLSILSLLVDLKPSEVRQEHPRARFKAIFKANEKLPLALLFHPPLTAKEREEVSSQFDKEEAAEIERGKTLRAPMKDTSYPLPTSLSSKPLPSQLGWMRQGENFIFFNNDLLNAGLRRPSLFTLPVPFRANISQYRFYDVSIPCRFTMHLDLVPREERAQISEVDNVHLLTSSELKATDAFQSSHMTFYGVLLTRESHSLRRNGMGGQNTREVCTYRYLCHVTCDAFETHESEHYSTSSGRGRTENISRERLVDNCEYRIRCDFSNVGAPSRHRIRGFAPPWITAFNIRTTIMPILLFYYLVCFGFTCIPVFAHTPGAFPRGWLAMIGFLFMMRLLLYTWNTGRDYRKAVYEVQFNAWVNGIGGDDDAAPIIDSQSRHSGFNINLSLRDSLTLALLCSVFIVAGAARYSDTGLRWMIAVGGSGLGELLLWWGLELCLPTSRFWAPGGIDGWRELPALRAEYLSPSRLTRWSRGLFRRE